MLLVVAISAASLFTLAGPSHGRVAEGTSANSSREVSREPRTREVAREPKAREVSREPKTREVSRELKEAKTREVARETKVSASSESAKEVRVKDLAPKVDHSKTDFQRATENAKQIADRQQAEKDRADMRDKTHDGLLRTNIGDRTSVGVDYSNESPEVNLRFSTDKPAKPKK